MNENLTVYFDTSFYINLARGSESEALECIDKLNQLKVRQVCSLLVLSELLATKNHSMQLPELFRRIGKFEIQSLRIPNEANWLLLALPIVPGVNSSMQNLLSFTRETSAQAESWSYIARNNYANDSELIETARQAGAPETSEEVLEFTRKWLAIAGLPNSFVPDELSPESAREMSTKLLEILGPDVVERIEREKDLIDESLSGPTGPKNLLIGKASSRTKQNVSATVRDAQHMNLFIQHSNQIDFLQVDGKQENKIRSSKGKHILCQYELDFRVFSASNLEQTIERIRELSRT